MRVHQLTFAALAVAAGLSLTACQSGTDSAGQSAPSSATAASSATDGSTAGGSNQGGGKDTAGQDSAGQSSAGKGTAAGSGSGSGTSGTATGRCHSDALDITAKDRTIDGDPDGTVVVELKNHGSRDCTLSGYAGVDLKTSAGSLSAQRTGTPAGPAVVKSGQSIDFGISYPLNTSGGSGVRITGLLVTPPNETRTVTLAWPGAGTLPVTEGGGTPVKVGPIGSAGQGG